jgi:hypothetical protein
LPISRLQRQRPPPTAAGRHRRPTASATVTIRRRKHAALADALDMTPEEHRRGGDATDALFCAVTRQIKRRP